MWDVDYLSTDHPLDKPLVYLYRSTSGTLIYPMIQALQAAADRQGYQLAACDDHAARAAVLGSSSLFGIPFTLWHVEPGSRVDDKIAKRVLGVMAAGQAERFALFLPEKSALTRRSSWLGIEKACFVVHERSITRDNLLPALRYLEQTTSLAKNLQLSSQQAFIDSFDDLLQEEEPEMVDLRREFNKRVVIYTDLEQQVFDGDRFKRDVPETRRLSSLDRGVRELLSSRDNLHLTNFIVSVDWLYRDRNWSPAQLLRQIYSLCCRELRNARRNKADWNPRRKGKVVARDLTNYEMVDRYILWSAIVLAWESRFVEVSSDVTFGLRRSSDLSIVKLHQIGRDFIARSSETTRKDRLTGLWDSLRLTLSRVGVSDSSLYLDARERLAHLSEGDLVARLRKWQEVQFLRYRLVCALTETFEMLPAERLSMYWLVRLKQLLDQARSRMFTLIEADD